jgi:hypothetical protein
VFGDLADYGRKLPRRHMGRLAFLDAPQLQEDVRPRFRISPAIERGDQSQLSAGAPWQMIAAGALLASGVF